MFVTILSSVQPDSARGASAWENNNHELRCVEDTAVLAETCCARTIAICFGDSCSRVIARTLVGERLD